MGWGEEVGREAVKYYIALNVGKVLLQSIRKLALFYYSSFGLSIYLPNGFCFSNKIWLTDIGSISVIKHS